MTNLAPAGSQPVVTNELLDRRPVANWAMLVLVAYIASAAVVRRLDYLSVHAQTAQIIQDAGPMHPVACEGCVGGPELGLVWLTDWRALLIWGLIAATAAVVVKLSRHSQSS